MERPAALAAPLVAALLVAGCVAPWAECGGWFSDPCFVLLGVTAEVPFEAPWNVTRAAEAVVAMGYELRVADEGGLSALHPTGPRLAIVAAQPDWEGNATFWLRAEYDNRERTGTVPEEAALGQAAELRDGLEADHAAWLERFGDATGWSPAAPTGWRPVMAPRT
ncbi:MAG: hypothetical protein ACPGQL_04945 [Thermoplasmatota archaeon]